MIPCVHSEDDIAMQLIKNIKINLSKQYAGFTKLIKYMN